MSIQTNPFAALAGHKNLSLETFRRTGAGVKTAVWFAEAPAGSPDAHTIYVYTIGNSGKAKRIRNNPHVRVAPCTTRGHILGDWVDARAEIVAGEIAARGMLLLDQKYFVKKILDFFASFSRNERIVLAIRAA